MSHPTATTLGELTGESVQSSRYNREAGATRIEGFQNTRMRPVRINNGQRMTRVRYALGDW